MYLFLDVGCGGGRAQSSRLQACFETPWTEKGEGWSVGCSAQQKKEQTLVGQSQQTSTRVARPLVPWVLAAKLQLLPGGSRASHSVLLRYGALVCPLSSLHPIRSWHRQWELWKYHRTLPLPWLFTGEVNKERDSAEQMLGPTGHPWRLMQRSRLHKQMPRGAAWKVSRSPKQTRTCCQT